MYSNCLLERWRGQTSCLHTRWDLDSRIGANDERYGAALSVMAAKLSYYIYNYQQTENKLLPRFLFLFLFSIPNFSLLFYSDYEEFYTTQAIMFQDKKVDPDFIVVAFRVTSPFDADDWLTGLHELEWLLDRMEGVYSFEKGGLRHFSGL
ncbi:unnamed protein product [Coffea canephora]|uniref:Uncharacterized protein n=1 Tax=Coffea canephora TaxID=49390 RepID=A0A068TZT9_COFCA|nr:unnamed protein product [Coffea canephora]